MPSADLTIRINGHTPWLRADTIRRNTIAALAMALREEPTGRQLIDLLDELGEAALCGPRDGELDALVQDIEDLADMGRAQMQLSRAELDQLARESADAVNKLTPKSVPAQPQRRAS